MKKICRGMRGKYPRVRAPLRISPAEKEIVGSCLGVETGDACGVILVRLCSANHYYHPIDTGQYEQ